MINANATGRPRTLIALSVALMFSGAALLVFFTGREPMPSSFDGQRAHGHVQTQVAMGPRTPGSTGHAALLVWLQTELEALGWQVEIQQLEHGGFSINNLVATRPDRRGVGDWILLGAHYDTRWIADQEIAADRRAQPVPGANDGASGVAVLLEMARVLPESLGHDIWLVFFDAEDNGDIDGREWAMGSQAFVNDLTLLPDNVVIVDMIGDADLNVYIEQHSSTALSAELWAQAAALGYADKIIPVPRYTMLDDHVAFVQAEIPAALMIDFDYPYWHTLDDTVDKVSAQSLQVIGDTLLAWVLAK